MRANTDGLTGDDLVGALGCHVAMPALDDYYPETNGCQAVYFGIRKSRNTQRAACAENCGIQGRYVSFEQNDSKPASGCFANRRQMANANPWDNAYKIVMVKTRGSKASLERSPEMLQRIVKTTLSRITRCVLGTLPHMAKLASAR